MKDVYHKYYEYFSIGEKFESGGRMVSDGDTRIILGIIGVSHPLHIDPVYCATRPDVLTPIAPGSLILGLIDAQVYEVVCPGGEVALIPDGYDKIRFLKPIHMGDTIRVEYEVTAIEDVDDKFGRITLSSTAYNQNSVAVTFALEHFLIEKENK